MFKILEGTVSIFFKINLIKPFSITLQRAPLGGGFLDLGTVGFSHRSLTFLSLEKYCKWILPI